MLFRSGADDGLNESSGPALVEQSRLGTSPIEAMQTIDVVGNGSFTRSNSSQLTGNFAQGITDPMHARVLALHDGKRALVFCVIDACMVPREVIAEAKRIVQAEAGVPARDILISATHTHSAATLAPVFQSDEDPAYVKAVPALVARGILHALRNLEPAEVGWEIGRAHV